MISGLGESCADFARAGTVGLDLVEAARLYLTIGGERNTWLGEWSLARYVAWCVKY